MNRNSNERMTGSLSKGVLCDRRNRDIFISHPTSPNGIQLTGDDVFSAPKTYNRKLTRGADYYIDRRCGFKKSMFRADMKKKVP